MLFYKNVKKYYPTIQFSILSVIIYGEKNTKSGIKNMHNNLEYISIMRYNKKRKYRIFGDGCNSLPAVIVTDYLAGW